MNTGTSATTQSPNVLTSWKDIARYMGKGVRTVQRWEQDFGLPVRRPQGSNKKAVLARPRDLDAWVALRCGSRSVNVAVTGKPEGESLRHLAALNAQIETSRRLCDSSRELIDQVHAAVDNLRRQIVSLQANR